MYVCVWEKKWQCEVHILLLSFHLKNLIIFQSLSTYRPALLYSGKRITCIRDGCALSRKRRHRKWWPTRSGIWSCVARNATKTSGRCSYVARNCTRLGPTSACPCWWWKSAACTDLKITSDRGYSQSEWTAFTITEVLRFFHDQIYSSIFWWIVIQMG